MSSKDQRPKSLTSGWATAMIAAIRDWASSSSAGAQQLKRWGETWKRLILFSHGRLGHPLRALILFRAAGPLFYGQASTAPDLPAWSNGSSSPDWVQQIIPYLWRRELTKAYKLIHRINRFSIQIVWKSFVLDEAVRSTGFLFPTLFFDVVAVKVWGRRLITMGAAATLRRVMAQDPVLTACFVLSAIGKQRAKFHLLSFGIASV